MALTSSQITSYKALINAVKMGVPNKVISEADATIKLAEWKTKNSVTDNDILASGLPVKVSDIVAGVVPIVNRTTTTTTTAKPTTSGTTSGTSSGTTQAGSSTTNTGSSESISPQDTGTQKKKISALGWVLIGVGSLIVIGGLTYLVIKITD